MGDQNYIALHLQTSGISSMPGVLQMLRDSKLADLCYAYKIRTKPEAKLLEKVERKKQIKPSYSLADITDVVGLRLVALFRAEMVDIFEGILSVITHNNGISPNPFDKGRPEEVIIYKGANVFDELPARLREVVGKLCPGLLIKEEHSKEGYSSVHLVTRLNISPESSPCKNYKIPIEIQVRSVFEDAWGEIDHKYGYLIRSGKDAGKPISNPEFVLAHLKVLKRFSDACMEYADAIRTEAVGVPPSLLATRKVVSVVSDSFIVDRFKELQVEENIIEKYCEARDVKDQAAERMDQNPPEGKQLYLNAAELFRELVSTLDAENLGSDASPGVRLTYYYLRMNEALCLMSTNERDQVVAAHGIYQSLESAYPEYPLLKMRYGQALGKLGHLDEALVRLREAGAIAEEIASNFIGQEPAAWPDRMPYTDYDHIVRTQPKLLGYHIWLKIRTFSPQDDEQKRVLFKEAYEITKKGLNAVEDHSPEQALSLHNNLLYYALGCLTRIGTALVNDKAGSDALKERVIEHVNYIEQHVADNRALSIPRADTIMKAYSVLGRQREASQVAAVILDKCLNQPTQELDEKETLKLVSLAYQVTRGESVGVID